MKYIIDIDSLKGCLDLIDSPAMMSGEKMLKLKDIKMLIDRFPKDKVEDEQE